MEPAEATPAIPPPSSLWAALLSLVCPGLGQAYAGHPLRGLTLWLGTMVFLPASLALAAFDPSRALLSLWLMAIAASLAIRVFAVVDAPRIARHGRRRATGPTRVSPGFLVLFGVVGVSESLAMPWFVRCEALGVYRMVERSMLPELGPGDRVLANRWAVGEGSSLRRGDVVVFRSPENRAQRYVKRVIGLPGDRVESREGRIFVNGRPLTMGPLLDELPRQGANAENVLCEESNTGRHYRVLASSSDPAERWESSVPTGQVFVLGDHRENSRDSRSFGEVPLGDVVGLVQYVCSPHSWWPFVLSTSP